MDLSELLGYANHLPLTKRSILKVSASLIFDLLGLVSPFMIRLKLMFGSLWTNNVKWDGPLQEVDTP